MAQAVTSLAKKADRVVSPRTATVRGVDRRRSLSLVFEANPKLWTTSSGPASPPYEGEVGRAFDGAYWRSLRLADAGGSAAGHRPIWVRPDPLGSRATKR